MSEALLVNGKLRAVSTGFAVCPCGTRVTADEGFRVTGLVEGQFSVETASLIPNPGVLLAAPSEFYFDSGDSQVKRYDGESYTPYP